MKLGLLTKHVLESAAKRINSCGGNVTSSKALLYVCLILNRNLVSSLPLPRPPPLPSLRVRQWRFTPNPNAALASPAALPPFLSLCSALPSPLPPSPLFLASLCYAPPGHPHSLTHSSILRSLLLLTTENKAERREREQKESLSEHGAFYE